MSEKMSGECREERREERNEEGFKHWLLDAL
jgi:hypothetical protein